MKPSLVYSLVAVIFLMGCSEGTPGGLSFCESTTEVIFDLQGRWLLPFPSDYYLIEDSSTPSGFRVNFTEENIPRGEGAFKNYEFLREQMNALDGFGTSAAIVFGFSDEIGTRDIDEEGNDLPPESLDIGPAGTMQADSPVVLLGLSEDSPDYGQAQPLILEYVSDVNPEGIGQHYLVVEPAFPLRPKTTYALALTRRLTDVNGQCVSPSHHTQRLVGGDEPETFGLLGERAPDAVDLLSERGFISDAGDLSALTVFTTQSIEEELLAAVTQLRKIDPPEIIEGSLEVTPGSGGAALVVTGRFEAPAFRSAQGTFVIEGGEPVVQGLEELEFELVIPEQTPENQPPYPLVIYQHGLTGSKEEDMGAKRAQARAGFASLAIDAVEHGTRYSGEGWDILNFFGIDTAAGAFDMPLLRDNFRQSFLDIVFLAELGPALARLDLLPLENPDGVAELASGPVYLSGHSLGAVIAAGALALSERITIGNLCAGGGRLTTNLFMRSTVFGTFIDFMKPEGTTTADIRRFMPLLQMLIERGDPINLARMVTSGSRHVLFQEVMDDSYVPNQSNEALSRALGLGHVEPVLRPVYGLDAVSEPAALNHSLDVTAGFFQFDLLADGRAAEHTEIYSDTTAQTQWIHFFETLRDSGQPEVVDPYRILGIDRP